MRGFLGLTFLLAPLTSLTNVHAYTSVCDADNDPWAVQLATSTQSPNVTYAVNITGTSLDGVSSISLVNNQGTVKQADRITNVISINRIPYGGKYVLYSLLGVDADSIMTSWAYCEGERLTHLYLESTRGNSGFTSSVLEGSCTVDQDVSVAPQLQVAAECIHLARLPEFPYISGGNTLSLVTGLPGLITSGGELFTLLPYAIVDCITCPADSRGGWIEVHAILKGRSSGDVCVGILYLFLQCTGTIDLQYVHCFSGPATSQAYAAQYDLSPIIGAASGGRCCSAQCAVGVATSTPMAFLPGTTGVPAQLVTPVSVIASWSGYEAGSSTVETTVAAGRTSPTQKAASSTPSTGAAHIARAASFWTSILSLFYVSLALLAS